MSVRTRIDIEIDRPRAEVWDYIKDIPTHVEWMVDATQIDMVGSQLAGEGSSFDCLTKIGPLRLHDRFVVSGWKETRLLEITHGGAFGGTGRFTLDDLNGVHTRFRWEEDLHFAWWLGGPLGSSIAAFVLRPIWLGNLRRLKRILESDDCC